MHRVLIKNGGKGEIYNDNNNNNNDNDNDNGNNDNNKGLLPISACYCRHTNSIGPCCIYLPILIDKWKYISSKKQFQMNYSIKMQHLMLPLNSLHYIFYNNTVR